MGTLGVMFKVSFSICPSTTTPAESSPLPQGFEAMSWERPGPAPLTTEHHPENPTETNSAFAAEPAAA